MTAGAELALLAEEGRVVDSEEHGHGGFVYADAGQSLGVLVVADGVANLETFQTYQCTDVATACLIRLLATHAGEGVNLLDLGALLASVAVHDGHVHTLAQGATVHTAYGNTAGIVGVVQAGNEHLGRTLQLLGSRHMLQYLVKKIGNVLGGSTPVLAHPVVLGRTIDHREIQLLLGGVEVAHQVEDHLIHLLGTAIGLVHLIDNNKWFQTYLQSLLQHKSCLRHRTLKSIHQKDTSVCHIEHTLHLATEVGVTRGVNDIDLCVAVYDGHILGKDGYTTFTFQLVVVQHQFARLLVLTEQVTCQKHLVHQGGLAMVYVRYNRYVTDILHVYVFFLCTILIPKRAQRYRKMAIWPILHLPNAQIKAFNIKNSLAHASFSAVFHTFAPAFDRRQCPNVWKLHGKQVTQFKIQQNYVFEFREEDRALHHLW